jgi:hypothetical protein
MPFDHESSNIWLNHAVDSYIFPSYRVHSNVPMTVPS